MAKVRARNIFGYGDYSEPNVSGATVQVEPFAAAAPTLDITASSLTEIKVDWEELTDDATGGSPITSYDL